MNVIYKEAVWETDYVSSVGQLAFLKAKEPTKLIVVSKYDYFAGHKERVSDVVQIDEVKPILTYFKDDNHTRKMGN